MKLVGKNISSHQEVKEKVGTRRSLAGGCLCVLFDADSYRQSLHRVAFLLPDTLRSSGRGLFLQ